MCTALTAIPFKILVQIFLMIRVVNLACEYAALVRLRYTRPNDPRPFSFPGGKIGAWCAGIPSAFLAGFCLVYADRLVWAAGGIVNGAILIAWGIKKLVEWNYRRLHPNAPVPRSSKINEVFEEDD